MEDLSVKQLLATTNKILIVVAVLFGLNLAADVLGLKSQDLVIKNASSESQIKPFVHSEPVQAWLKKPKGY